MKKKKNFEVPVMDAEFDDPDIEMVVLRLRMKRSHWVTERISCSARFDVRLPTKRRTSLFKGSSWALQSAKVPHSKRLFQDLSLC